MGLAIFDLDNTLLNGDSDQLWGAFVAEKLDVDKDEHIRISEQFYQDYLDGVLDVEEFLLFTLSPLAKNSMKTLHKWRAEFIEKHINGIVLPKAVELVEKHRNSGDTLMIITATNSFITRPIADIFNIETLLATEPEIADGQYTGKYTGTPTFKEGKIVALENWLLDNDITPTETFFYSDSHNDIPLLEKVDHPVAVDPDKELEKFATEKGWQITSLR